MLSSFGATAAAQTPDLYYWNDTAETLFRTCSDGSCSPAAVHAFDGTTTHGPIFGFDVDLDNGHLYYGTGWTWEKPVALYRSDLDGSNVVLLRDDLFGAGVEIVRTLSVDNTAGHLYFTDDKDIWRTNLDGTGLVRAVPLGWGGRFSIDWATHTIYWVDSNSAHLLAMFRMPLGGTALDIEQLTAKLTTQSPLKVDSNGGKIYYQRFGQKSRIYRADLDMSGEEELGYLGDDSVDFHFDATHNELYYSTFTPFQEGSVRRFSLSNPLPWHYSSGHDVVAPGKAQVLVFQFTGDRAGGVADSDEDGVEDSADNCPAVPNPLQEDLDVDGLGDACDDDADGDGDPAGTDCDDLDPTRYAGATELCADGIDNNCNGFVDLDEDGADCDGDLVDNGSDNCPIDYNPLQEDLDDDGDGDACDADDDGDGVDDGADNCPVVSNAGQADFDGDGAGDACDDDSDGDGVGDFDGDMCHFTTQDEPTKGLGKNRWADIDGNGIFDTSGKNPTGRSYTLAETAGCSCSQIIALCGYGNGHEKFGCSNSVMDAFSGKYDYAGGDVGVCE